MVTMQQRIEALRTQKGLSRPALSAALCLPRTAVEKFETGRQTPTQDQQEKLARYFGVSVFYLRGESDDPTQMDSWLNGSYPEEPEAPAPRSAPTKAPSRPSRPQEDGAVFQALLKSDSFRELIRQSVLEVLRSPEGQELLGKAARAAQDRR